MLEYDIKKSTSQKLFQFLLKEIYNWENRGNDLDRF